MSAYLSPSLASEKVKIETKEERLQIMVGKKRTRKKEEQIKVSLKKKKKAEHYQKYYQKSNNASQTIASKE